MARAKRQAATTYHITNARTLPKKGQTSTKMLVGAIVAAALALSVRFVGRSYIDSKVDEAVRLLDEGRPQDALHSLKKMRSIGRAIRYDTLQFTFCLGRALLESDAENNVAAAAKEFQRATDIYGAYWPAYANLATTLFALGRYPEALDAVQEAISGVEALPSDDSDDLRAELYLNKGVILLEIPESRCSGGSCHEFAAQVGFKKT